MATTFKPEKLVEKMTLKNQILEREIRYYTSIFIHFSFLQ